MINNFRKLTPLKISKISSYLVVTKFPCWRLAQYLVEYNAHLLTQCFHQTFIKVLCSFFYRNRNFTMIQCWTFDNSILFVDIVQKQIKKKYAQESCKWTVYNIKHSLQLQKIISNFEKWVRIKSFQHPFNGISTRLSKKKKKNLLSYMQNIW